MSFVVFCFVAIWRIREINELKFVAINGYSKRWKKGDRIVGTSADVDPRIKRDKEER